MKQRQEEYNPSAHKRAQALPAEVVRTNDDFGFLRAGLINRVCWRGECNTPPVGNVLDPRLTTKPCDGKMGLAGRAGANEIILATTCQLVK